MSHERTLYTVYVKTNADDYIIAVNSSAFMSNTTGWVEIDSGYGDKYGHAQSIYFQKPITTYSDVYRYKLVDGKPVECAAEEIAEQEFLVNNEHTITLENRVESLETESAEIKEALKIILLGE